jgi:hypothetical protein
MIYVALIRTALHMVAKGLKKERPEMATVDGYF